MTVEEYTRGYIQAINDLILKRYGTKNKHSRTPKSV